VENVAALLYRGLGDVLRDLAALGYDAEWHCIPAAYVGAPIDREGRDRIWIVAYPNDRGFRGPGLSRELARELVGCPPWSDCTRGGIPSSASDNGEDQPRIPRVADGVSNRAHRIAAIGNAVCPPVVAAIGRAIMALEQH
jgi:DNA (cytosine-5)-methyltransferase 1